MSAEHEPDWVVVVGGSAGALSALGDIFRHLPDAQSVAVLAVLHMHPRGSGYAEVLASQSGAAVREGAEGAPIQRGSAYLAPPDRHMSVRDGRLHLDRGPRVNHARPAVDVLFHSAARAYGPRVIGVILSGHLDDGTFGLMMVKSRGGVAVVQSPRDARAPGMPSSALTHVAVDHRATSAELGPLLMRLTSTPPTLSPRTESAGNGNVASEAESLHKPLSEEPGKDPSVFTCPDCGGSLWSFASAGGALIYKCRVGHAYAELELARGEDAEIERALWSAMRAMKEKISLCRRIAERYEGLHDPTPADKFRQQIVETEGHVRVLRSLLTGPPLPEDLPRH